MAANITSQLIHHLILAPTYPNMGSHNMKTAIEIDDELFASIQRVAHEMNTTVNALVEQGLQMALTEIQANCGPWKWRPLVAQGGGLTDEFKNASWEQIRDEIYRGHGA